MNRWECIISTIAAGELSEDNPDKALVMYVHESDRDSLNGFVSGIPGSDLGRYYESLTTWKRAVATFEFTSSAAIARAAQRSREMAQVEQ